MTMTKVIFDEFRVIAGGRLSQHQVSKINGLIDELKTMKTSQAGIDFISNFEGLELKAYLCPAKVWTIGFGTTVYPNGSKVKSGDVCTRDQAIQFKQHDLNRFEKSVIDAVKVPINQNQFDALVSLAYNIGSSAFANSTLVKKLNAGDYVGASNQFDVWNKGGGKILKGLVNRRAKEKSVFLKGENQ